MCTLPLLAFHILVMPNHLLFPENALRFHTSTYLHAIPSVSNNSFLLVHLPTSCLSSCTVASYLKAVTMPPWRTAWSTEAASTMQMSVT